MKAGRSQGKANTAEFAKGRQAVDWSSKTDPLPDNKMDTLDFNEQRIVKDPAVALQGQPNGTYLGVPVKADGSKGEPTVFVSAQGHSIKNMIQPGVQGWILTRLDIDAQQQYNEQQRQNQSERQTTGLAR